MPNPQSTAAGDRFNFGFFLDSDGFPIGKTRTRPAVGTSTNGGPLRFPWAKSATPTSRPQPTVTVVTGEDGSDQHRYPFDADNTQITTLTLSAQDLYQAGLVQNMPVTQYGGGRFGYAGIADVDIPDMALILQSRSIDVASGTGRWSGILHPRVSLTYQGRGGFTERGAAEYVYSFTAQPSGYDFGGFTIVDLDGNPKQVDTMPFDDFQYPITLQAFTGDGAEDTFDLDYHPIDTDSIEVFLISHISSVRGAVLATVNAVQTTAPYNFQLSAAPSPSARRGVALYQFSG